MLAALIHKGDIGQIVLLVVIIIFLVVAYRILPKDMDYIEPLEKEDTPEENEPKEEPWQHFF